MKSKCVTIARSDHCFSRVTSFRGAPESSIIPQQCTVCVCVRAVRSLIQNHRPLTDTHTRPPPAAPRAPRAHSPAPHTASTSTVLLSERDSPLVVCFLTVCRESLSVAVTAAVRPPECALRWPHTNLLLPGEAPLQSQRAAGDGHPSQPITSTLSSERRGRCPIAARQTLRRHQTHF